MKCYGCGKKLFTSNVKDLSRKTLIYKGKTECLLCNNGCYFYKVDLADSTGKVGECCNCGKITPLENVVKEITIMVEKYRRSNFFDEKF